MAKYRILALDGGGIRGLLTARLLDRLNSSAGIINWLDRTDFFAGTSTGGILALGLAVGMTPREGAELYAENGPEIFDDSIWDDVMDLGRTVGAEYSNKKLKAVLKRTFGETRLRDIRKKVAIPTFDLDNEGAHGDPREWKPKIFHNFKGSDSDGGFAVADVALYTSAAPTFFPSADGYIDGGVFANNPSMVALAQAISSANQPAERVNLSDIVLLSVGTGRSLQYIKGKSVDWGYAQWIKPLVKILMDGVAGISDYQARQLLGDRYHRLQVTFPPDESIDVDSVSKIERLESIAGVHPIGPTAAWLRANWT